MTIYLVGPFASEHTMTMIKNNIGKYLKPVLITMTLTETILSLIALKFKKWAGVKRRFSLLFLVTSIGLCFLLMIAYIGSKMGGVLG